MRISSSSPEAEAFNDASEHLLRVLQVKKIKFESFDLASNEDAKKLWRRKAPPSECPEISVRGTKAQLNDIHRQPTASWHFSRRQVPGYLCRLV